MWIKHNKALYNSNDIKKIEVKRTKILATFNDGEEVVIGEFKTMSEAESILRNITQSLLFENKDHPGIIIKDTKEKKNAKDNT